MRKLSELYEVVRDRCIYRDSWGSFIGICSTVSLLRVISEIDGAERDAIKLDMVVYGVSSVPNAYWFKPGELQPRLDWLKERIEKLKKEGL